MKLQLVLLISLFVHHSCLSQRQANIWYFGNQAGLDFNSGSPVSIDDGQTYYVSCMACHNEGTAIISDSSGTLLFYSNGEKIWNKNHQVMPNGDNLLGGASSTQAALIVPKPGSSRYFYAFTTNDFHQHGLQYGFRYSIIDMCLDGGLGDVMSGQKNILLLDTIAEKVTAIRHQNGIDYWVITHKYFSDAFYAYHLSATGFIDTVVSNVGAIHPTGLQNIPAAIGQLKGSPNGQKLAIVNGNSTNNIAEYFDFDSETGVVSNPVDLQWNINYNFYGVSFSSDNSKLYISSILNGNGLYQFDLNAGGGDPDSVRASRVSLLSGINHSFRGLQLATDGKIYATRSPNNWHPYLSVIDNPNGMGSSCNYLDEAVDLDGMDASYGLPNFIDSFDYSNTTCDCAVSVKNEENNSPVIYPNPARGLLNIEFADNQKRQIKLFNMYGALVENFSISSNKSLLNIERLSTGVYCLVAIDMNQKVSIQQIIKE